VQYLEIRGHLIGAGSRPAGCRSILTTDNLSVWGVNVEVGRHLQRTGITERAYRIGIAKGDIEEPDHIDHISIIVAVDIGGGAGTESRWIEHIREVPESNIHCLHHIQHINVAVTLRVGMAITSAVKLRKNEAGEAGHFTPDRVGTEIV
jgi:hypothetical protein